jgi:putative transposase
MKAIRTEIHILNRGHPMWKSCDELCFQSKNMYNLCNYTIRQEFISSGKVMKYGDLNKILKKTDTFKELGSNSAQMVTQILCKSWKSFLVAVKDYAKNPDKYLGKPRIPGYKKKDGRFICTLTNCQTRIIDGYLHFGFKRLHPYNKMFKTKVDGYHLSTRIVPSGGCYVLEIVYEKEIEQLDLNKNNIASIDLGVNNFVTMVNNIGIKPIVINGRGIKSYNQYWNKQIAKYRSVLKKTNKLDWSKRLQRMTDKRNFKMDYFTHCASKYLVWYCINNDIGTIVVGKNNRWKQESKMSTTNNQKFIQIPYDLFIKKLKYKCEEIGINIIENEEGYTSGTSFLDNEEPIKSNYNKSRRIHRGLFESNNGIKINADCNGAYQIMRKVFSNVNANEIVDVHLHPVIINL